MRDSIRVSLYQQRLLGAIPEEDRKRLKELQPDFLCLPEYFFVRPDARDHRDEADLAPRHLAALQAWSVDLDTVLVGGSLVERDGERIVNRCTVFDRGQRVGHYDKRHLFKGEQISGLSPGHEPAVFDVGGIRIGILICADVLHKESFLDMYRLNADIVFVPTTSPFKEETVAEKFRRDEDLFRGGARTGAAWVAKCCAVGTIFGHVLQGRSLFASPDRVLRRARPDQEDSPLILTETLSVGTMRRLKEVRTHRNSTS